MYQSLLNLCYIQSCNLQVRRQTSVPCMHMDLLEYCKYNNILNNTITEGKH